VSSTNSLGTVANNAFILINVGSVELTQLTFQHLKSSVGVISINGEGTLLLDEVSITNITFSGIGSLISSSGGSLSSGNISIINTNISSISASGLNGSVICVNESVGSIYVYNSAFMGSSGYFNGGAFYIINCGNTLIDNSTFSGYQTSSDGKGGAIYFGLGSSFALVNSIFENCLSLYGGAIFSESEESGVRQIKNVSFSNNSVHSGGNGNDIADNSSVAVLIYTAASVIDSSSNSTTSDSIFNFYLIQQSGNLDCFLSGGGCVSDPLFVNTSGIDTPVCGSSSSPCRSVGQAVNILRAFQDLDATIIVESGSYTDTALEVHSMILSVTTNSNVRPILSLVSPPICMLLFVVLQYFFFIFFFFLF
jgi:hypothetical protein